MKKRTLSLVLVVLVLLTALAACQPPSPSVPTESPDGTAVPTPTESPDATQDPGSAQEGDVSTAFKSILDAAALGEMGEMDEGTLSADNVQLMTGLTPAELSELVTDSYYNYPMISVSAHTVALLQCKDETAAAAVKEKIAAGFDPWQWVCVSPQQCFVQESGSYVLLVASTRDVTEKLKTAFAETMGTVGECDVFYDGEADLGDDQPL